MFPHPVNSEDIYHVVSGNCFILQLISLLGPAQYIWHPSEWCEMAYHEYFLQLGIPPRLSPLFYHPEGHGVVVQTRITRKGKSEWDWLVNSVSLYYWLDHISTYKSIYMKNNDKDIYKRHYDIILYWQDPSHTELGNSCSPGPAISKTKFYLNYDGTKSLSVNLNDSAVGWKF